jgi:hypothetical protein
VPNFGLELELEFGLIRWVLGVDHRVIWFRHRKEAMNTAVKLRAVTFINSKMPTIFSSGS